ncbi:gluconokinase [Cohnella caldifontis]|uniref:gluconokinase n=1 Tax=Cohnella caldifontis TaxID=3027471 RepID=UPI0023EC7100|nr:gluconokinase [Cohnella sp. YIM B05605]
MNGEKKAILAVDIGTTSTKTLAVDLSGRILSRRSISYPLHTPRPGYAEQDPDVIREAVLDGIAGTVREARLAPGDVLCVSFSSANHSLIPMDGHGNPLMSMITWADLRSVAQAERLKQSGAGLANYLRTGTPIHPMSPLSKLIWLREERPDLFAASRFFIGIKEFVLHRLFGEYVTDFSMAGGTGLFSVDSLTWDPQALELAGAREDQLPRLAPTTEILSGLRRETADRLGLSVNTPFVLGAQDGVLANLGIGAVEDGVWAVTIGTSSAVRGAVPKPFLEPEGRLFCYALTRDLWIAGGPSNNGAIVAQWITERLFPGRALEDVLPLAEDVPAGADGLLFLPLLSGERAPFWDARAKGVLFGLTLSHKETHMLRAAMEGVLFQIAAIAGLMERSGGKAREIRASGGFARSALWCRMLADMLGVPVRVPESVESSGLGAAQLGLYAMNGEQGPLWRWRDAGGAVYEPDPAPSAVYRDMLPFYLDLYERLKEPMSTADRLRSSAALRNHA